MVSEDATGTFLTMVDIVCKSNVMVLVKNELLGSINVLMMFDRTWVLSLLSRMPVK